jgi:protoporphyrinogen oxidase
MGKGERAVKISRQSFLAKGLTMLGSLSGLGSFSLLSCTRKSQPIPGRMVGANAKVGHLLRTGKLGVPTRTIEHSVVIVGGGVSGLSAARTLKKQGVPDFVLLELDEQLGGNAVSGGNESTEYPWGAHYLPLPNAENHDLLAFLEEHDIITGYDADDKPIYNEYYLCFDPEDRLYMKGQWQEGLIPNMGLTPRDQSDIKRFFDLIAAYKQAKGKDGKWAFTIPVAECSADEDFTSLDRLTMKQFLKQQGLPSAYLHWYLNYCCRDDFGTELKDTSAWAGIHYFASRRAVAANAEPSAVLTWPEGNGFLVKQLRQALVSHEQASCLVYRLTLEAGKVLVDTFDWKKQELVRIKADKVILAVPQFIVQRLLTAESPRSASFYQAFTYAPWLVANLTLSQKPNASSGPPLSWDNVFYDSTSLGYVYANHMNLSQHSAKHVLTYYLPLSGASPKIARIDAYRRSFESWSARIMDDMRKVHPEIDQLVERIDLKVWGHGMIRPTKGFITGAERQQALQPINDQLFFAHSDLSGISIFEEAFYQGNRAAKELLHSLSSSRHVG